MRFFDTFDRDKLLRHVLPRLERALIAWQRGMATDENALMNQITSEFNQERSRKCDIGINGTYYVESELAELHRKGDNQKDRHGSDLALTVTAPDFKKTAFFQFKISSNGVARIEKGQITDAKVVKEVYERAFLFSVDRSNGLIRLESLDKLDVAFGREATKGFSIAKWKGLAQWLVDWLRCVEGKPTRADDPKPVEGLLKRFSLEPRRIAPFTKWELPPEYLPSRAWLDMSIEPKEK